MIELLDVVLLDGAVVVVAERMAEEKPAPGAVSEDGAGPKCRPIRQVRIGGTREAI